MMRRTLILPALVAIGVGSVAPPARAQSLADIARQESERRKALKDQTKTLTNDDLHGAPSPSTPAQPAADDGSSKTGDTKTDSKDAGKSADKDQAKDSPKDQKYWADRNKSLHDKLTEDKILVDAMQTRVSSLTTDFVNRDDPAQRAAIGQDKQKALDELAILQQAVANDNKAIADLEEEARKAGAPAGWLR